MATKNVGVRELKLNAPSLVERAARGERILITRYGRPRAQLGPMDDRDRPESPQSPQLSAWAKEKEAFERLLPRIERRYRGRYVAVAGGRVIDADVDHEALYQRLWKADPRRVFFIGRVGGPPKIVEMPGFEIE